MGQVGSGLLSIISNKYTIYSYMQETDYSWIILFIMTRSRNIAIYYRLIIYSNIKDVLFGQKAVASETMMLASELKSHLVEAKWQN